MQIYIDSIFPECEDVDECILNAANSIGLKAIPRYEVKMGEQFDWIKKTQVYCFAFSLYHNGIIGIIVMLI